MLSLSLSDVNHVSHTERWFVCPGYGHSAPGIRSTAGARADFATQSYLPGVARGRRDARAIYNKSKHPTDYGKATLS